MKKNAFRQHIPSFCDVDDPIEIQFDEQEELLSHDLFNETKRDPHFDGFCLSDNLLIYLRKKWKEWWVLGYIKYPNLMNLPKWKGPS